MSAEQAEQLVQAYRRCVSTRATWLRCPVQVAAGQDVMATLRAQIPVRPAQRRGIILTPHVDPKALEISKSPGMVISAQFQEMSAAVQETTLLRRFAETVHARQQVITDHGLGRELAALLPPASELSDRQDWRVSQAWAQARLAMAHEPQLSIAEYELLLTPARAGWQAR